MEKLCFVETGDFVCSLDLKNDFSTNDDVCVEDADGLALVPHRNRHFFFNFKSRSPEFDRE